MTLLRPPRLQPGDRVAAVTLSWGGPGAYPERYEQGKRQLEEAFGVEVVEMEHTLASEDDVAAHPEWRAHDLHAALTDPTIAGLFSTIGGDESIRVLRHLDLDLIAANPKVLLGFSDTTVTQMAFLRAGVVSFYGPSIMAGFAETGGLHDYLVQGVRATLFDVGKHPVAWPRNTDGWTAELTPWEAGADAEPRRLQPSDGWRWHGGQAAEGPAIVACLEVLDFLRGTDWWPDLAGAVLILETSEEQPEPSVIARFLRTLATTGELAGLAGLGLGRPASSPDHAPTHDAYDQALLDVVRDEEGLGELPVVTGLDVGHTSPTWTVPIGPPVRLDPAAESITFLTPGVT